MVSCGMRRVRRVSIGQVSRVFGMAVLVVDSEKAYSNRTGRRMAFFNVSPSTYKNEKGGWLTNRKSSVRAIESST